MGFSVPFFHKKEESSEYFALYLTDSSATGFIFSPVGGVGTIGASSSVAYTQGFDNVSTDIDTLISTIVPGGESTLSKTIFFLHSWMIDTESAEIKDPYKGIIKKIAKELKLDPMGYIDVQEALVEYLRSKTLQDTITIEVNKTKWGVAIFHEGKQIFSQYTARTDSPGDDIQSILQSLPRHIHLPSSIHVFGHEDMDLVRTELEAFDWEPHVFLQKPSLDVISQSELHSLLVKIVSQEVISQDEISNAPVDPLVTTDQVTVGEVVQSEDEFRSVVGGDVRAKQPIISEPSILPSEVTRIEPPSRSRSRFALPSFSLSLPGKLTGKKPILVGALAGIVLFSLFAIYEYFFHTIEITVYPKVQAFQKSFDLTPSVITGESPSEFAVILRETSKEYEESIATTGKRDVGEKAKGTVEVLNFDSDQKTFAKGTVLRKGDLEFLLDNELKVASSSGLTSEGNKVPGKQKGSVTAKEIGPTSNITKATVLSVGSLSQTLAVAIADSAFTGGTKKEVQTIARVDMDKLKKSVEEKASAIDTNVLGAQISMNEQLLSDLTDISLGKTTYSGQVGDEAKQLKIKAESTVSYFTYDQELLKKELLTLVQKELSEGIEVEEDISFSIDAAKIDTKDKLANLVADVDAKTYKKIALEEIRKQSVRTSFSGLPAKLTASQELAEVKVKSSSPFSLWTPLFEKNITVTTRIDPE